MLPTMCAAAGGRVLLRAVRLRLPAGCPLIPRRRVPTTTTPMGWGEPGEGRRAFHGCVCVCE